MAARPPPARPHIGLNPSFHHQTTAEWGEDDAWDSASDSESPRQSIIANPWLPPSRLASTATSPKPVPRSSASSSTLASSYTHLNAPNPSSYPPRVEQVQQAQGNGWTIVRKSTDTRASTEEIKEEDHDDGDYESEMVVGELEPDVAAEPLPSKKPSLELGIIRDDVDEIVNGPYLNINSGLFSISLFA
ncbi:hypothetical protein PILCRDRAFT_442135 [Piloderma croceum F 1598]|uniref:Uncharacterized protein n=1 Tax=Piloderma croceum (strain F 1598) TaxID=765440 RepID=A0A0C3FYS2_PILCF|nr:hypothetical protein PILCRDRAFT_442135 [Piloderma croceum F 1598]